jgi:membrane-bound metal-dependent hydrolase YbcI (DUF457 family)
MLIPAMLAIIAGLSKKKTLLLTLIAVIPDLDAAFNAHRLYLHTIFIPIVIAAFALACSQKKTWKPYAQLIFITALFYASHIFLDFFNSPVGLLWPLTNTGYAINLSLHVTQQGIIPFASVGFNIITQQMIIPNSLVDVPAISPESIAVAFLLLLALLIPQRKTLRFIKKKNTHKGKIGVYRNPNGT